MTKLKWLVAIGLGAVVLVVGGTWVYINVIREDAPPPLALDDLSEDGDASTSTTSAPAQDDDGGGSIEGTWSAAAGSIAGYRVDEILFGQSVEAVGRTEDVDGTITIEGTTVTDASFVIDMTTVSSDESRRDGQFRGAIMDVDQFPTATFELTEPIELGDVAAGSEVTVDATGELTLRGSTQTVTIPLEARHSEGRIEVVGSFTVVFADWEIPNPSRPGIDTEDEGVLEVLLAFEPA